MHSAFAPERAASASSAAAVPVLSSPFTARHWGLLAAITVLGTALRLLRLDVWSFWVDEAHTWRDATLASETFWTTSNQRWYPTSYALLRWMLTVMDPTQVEEWHLRMPFTLAGCLSVPLLAIFGRSLVGRSAALLASLLLAINPWHIYWSQNARAYSLVVLFSLVACGVFWVGMQRRSWWILSLAALAGFVCLTCHLSGGFVFAPMVVYPLLAGRRIDLRSGLMAGAVFALGVAVVEIVSHMPPFNEFAKAKAGPGLVHLLQTTAFYFRPSLLLVAAVGAVLMLQQRVAGRSLYLTLWTLLPLLALAYVGTHLTKVTARYAIATLPAITWLCGYACVRIGKSLHHATHGGKWTKLLSSLILPAIVCLDMSAYDFLYFTIQKGDRAQWRDAAAAVKQMAPDKRMVVLTVNEPTMQFYLRRWHYAPERASPEDAACEVVDIQTKRMSDAGGAVAWFEAQRERAAAAGKPIFAVLTLPELREKDPDQRLEHEIRTQMELVHVLQVLVGPKDETIYVYKLRGQ